MEPFRPVKRLSSVWRSVSIVVVLGVMLAGCSWSGGSSSHATRLRLTVYRGDGIPRRHLSLSCPDATASEGGTGGLCAALGDFVPRVMHKRAACSCGIYAQRVVVTGVINGQRIRHPVEVSWCSACGLVKRARKDVEFVYGWFGLTVASG